MKLQRQIDQLLAQRASEWHQILENADESQRAEFVAWLKQSPLHLQEYLETVYTDQILKHMDKQRLEDVDALLAQAAPSVVPLAAIRSTGGFSRHRLGRRTMGLAAAAGVAVCALLLPFVFNQFAAPDYSTTIGEQRTIQLPDASIVTLNADSQIRIRLDKTRRDIQLLRGEALFQVARDPARPFRVRTDTVIVQAVGTQFNVYKRPNDIRVSVLEGRVNVTPQGAASSGSRDAADTTASLGAGQEAQVKPDGTIQRNAHADVMKTIAWRERRLIFEDAPLEEMVYEFNRYSRAVRLTLDDVKLGTHHYNGIFDAADPESLADLLSKEPDLSVERRRGEIVIRQR